MERVRWQRVEALLDQVLELDADAAAAFLDAECRDDDRLRAEVEALLSADAAAGDFLRQPAAERLRERSAADLEPFLPDDRSMSWAEELSGRQLGPYEVLRRIGEGGMGVVYEARDPRLERSVALKVLPFRGATGGDEQRARFLREARAASALDHPNICTLYDVGETPDGQLYLVMAYYAGETLAERLRRGPVPVDEALSIAIELARGLQAAHVAGIVHRDVKPANVMLTREGSVKILDFGVARITDSPVLTRTGAAVGTPAYMAPEQARGEPVTPKVDVWAWGLILYEMLTGTQPFRTDSHSSTLLAIQQTEPVPLERLCPKVNRAVTLVVRRALAKKPKQRYLGLRDALADLGVEPTPTPVQHVPAVRGPAWLGAWKRTRSVRQGALVVVLGLGVTVLAWYLWTSGRSGTHTPLPSGDGAAATVLVEGGPDGSQIGVDGVTAREWERRGAEALQGFWRVGQVDAAVEAYQRAVVLAPERAAAHSGLARALWRRYRASRDRAWLLQAEANARRAVELDEHLAAGWVSLGLVQSAQGQREEAADIFARVVRIDPANADAHRGLADLARQAGDIEAAITGFQRAVALRPEDMELHSLFGGLYYRVARYEDAEAEFRRALDLDPDENSSYKNLAAALHMQGRYPEAAQTLQQALALEPEEEVYTNLGTLYYFQGLYPQALSAFEKAAELTPGDARVWGNLGDARRRLPGQEALAREAFRTGLEILAEEMKAGPKESGQATAEAPSQLAPSQLALAAEYSAKAGDVDRARQWLDRLDAAATDGLAVEVHSLFNAVQAAEVLGDRQRALDYLRRTLEAGYPRHEVAAEPDLAALRQDARYRVLLAQLAPERSSR